MLNFSHIYHLLFEIYTLKIYGDVCLQTSGAQREYLKCSIRGTNNQIRNSFYKSVHLQMFSVKCKLAYLQLSSNINLLNFNCLTSNFCFPKNIFFASRRERMFMDARPQFQVFNSTGKMMTCYLRYTNKFLRSSTLCTNILKCKFPAKGIELTRLEFLRDQQGLSFEALGLDHFCRFGLKFCRIEVNL